MTRFVRGNYDANQRHDERLAGKLRTQKLTKKTPTRAMPQEPELRMPTVAAAMHGCEIAFRPNGRNARFSPNLSPNRQPAYSGTFGRFQSDEYMPFLGIRDSLDLYTIWA
jgi:hypothetical protein